MGEHGVVGGEGVGGVGVVLVAGVLPVLLHRARRQLQPVRLHKGVHRGGHLQLGGR